MNTRILPALNILIVDNDQKNINLLTNILEEKMYTVSRTDDQSALETARLLLPEVVLLASNLANVNSYELCRSLKIDQITRNIPVIITGTPDELADKGQIFAAGATDYLPQPYQPEEVLARVEPHLAIQRLWGQLENQSAVFQNMSKRQQSEIAVARDIQRGLLPPASPNWPGLDVACYTQSAREVGGDFYTYHTFDTRLRRNEQRYAFAIGDVSGKGMPAALLMAISLASFKNLVTQAYSFNKLVTDLVTQTYSLSQFLSDLDKAIAFYTATTRQNCAMVYVELTKPTEPDKSSTMRAVNAGCMMPIIRRVDGSVEWVEIGGMPLGAGLGADFGYQEQQLNLSPGDLIILTSDGVVEANNSIDEMLGFDRLEQIVVSGPQDSARAMQEHLQLKVADFVGNTEPHDDMTMVVIQV